MRYASDGRYLTKMIIRINEVCCLRKRKEKQFAKGSEHYMMWVTENFVTKTQYMTTP
jgi:hypothetical protein